MIAQLTGTIAARDEKSIVLDVGGVGYRLHLSSETRAALPKSAGSLTLWTYLAVRENALELYGFLNRTEHNLFTRLLGVTGIGPKSAIAILSLAPPAVLEKAIVAGDSAYLTKVSGIGKKTADKIILELKDKILPTGGSTDGFTLAGEAETIEALQALGYNLREAHEALARVPRDLTETSAKIKAALKTLGKHP